MVSTIVIVGAYRPHLTRCLDSIRGQGLYNSEVILVHRGLEEHLEETLRREYGLISVRQIGEGIANARNEGLRHCRGGFIAFLDADDYWVPGKLELQTQCLLGDPELMAVTGYLVKEILGSRQQEPHVALTPSGALFRREAFETYGHFCEEYQIASDHEMFLRLKRSGAKCHVLDDVVMIKTIHERNLSHRRGDYRNELMHLLRERSR